MQNTIVSIKVTRPIVRIRHALRINMSAPTDSASIKPGVVTVSPTAAMDQMKSIVCRRMAL